MKISKKNIGIILIGFILFFTGIVLLLLGCLSTNTTMVYISIVLIFIAIIVYIYSFITIYLAYKDGKKNE